MNRLRILFSRVLGSLRKQSGEERLEEEFRSHLDSLAQKYIRRGMSAEEARYSARREFGGIEQTKENYREQFGLPFFDSLAQDVRYAMRVLGRSPGFTLAAVLTLALGIGANTAIFSLFDSVMLRSMPVLDPQDLVVLNWTAHKDPKYHSYSSRGDCGSREESKNTGCSFSVPFFETLDSKAQVFSSLTAFSGPVQVDFSGNGPASMAMGELVSGDFFSTLGVGTFLGRPLGPDDDSLSATPAIVLSYAYWRSAFGGDRAVVGRTVRVNSSPFLIVGVADARFTNLAPGKTQDFFMPLSWIDKAKSEFWGNTPPLKDTYRWWVVMVGRLKPGVSIGQTQAEVSTVFRNEMLHEAMSKEEDAPSVLLRPVLQGLTGERRQVAPALYLMMIAVGFILLTACANIAGLLLARSETRQKEMAVRLALGGGRARIVRQLLTESVMLALAGATLGVLFAVWGVDAITRLISSGIDEPFPFVVSPDWRVLAFTACVTLVTGILLGLAPALRSARIDLTPALKGTAWSLSGGKQRTGSRFRLGDALVVVQVALSIVVLAGAGLLVRTLQNLHSVNPGFDTQNILLFGIEPKLAGYSDEQSAQLYRELQQKFAALPGVVSVGYSSDALLSNSLWGMSVHLDGTPPNTNVDADMLGISPDFFSTMHIPLLVGREFTSADFAAAATRRAAEKEADKAASAEKIAGARETTTKSPSTPPMPVIVNEAFVHKFFPKEPPLGKHIGDYEGEDASPGPKPGYVIVGIVPNTKYNSLRREIQPTMIVPHTGGGAHFELRAAGDAAAFIKLVRDVVLRRDNNLPLYHMRTQTEQIEQTLFLERSVARLSSFCGLLALALACIGLYGLLSYDVARRTREIGIRVALGAHRRHVVQLAVGQGLLLTLAGAVLGACGAIGVTRFMASMLYGVRANDPLTMIAVVVLLAAVAALAAYLPVARATRVDPVIALRYE